MAVELIFVPEAEEDVDGAYAWYESRRSGLGEEFMSCVDACLQAIRRNPEMYACAHESYRRALVRRFPYSVFYECADDIVIVYCIFHNAQNPVKWRQRLP